MLYSIELRSQYLAGPVPGKDLFGGGLFDDALGLFDASLLAGKLAEVEDACPADLTDLVELDGLDGRKLVRENPLDSDAAGNLADGESPGERGGTANLDDDALELLKSFLVTFLDPVGHGDGVTGLELRIGSGLVLRECLLYNLDVIHNNQKSVSSATLL